MKGTNMFPILQVADYIQDKKKTNKGNYLCLIKVSNFVLLDTQVPVSIVCLAAPEYSAFPANASNGEHYWRIRTQRCWYTKTAFYVSDTSSCYPFHPNHSCFLILHSFLTASQGLCLEGITASGEVPQTGNFFSLTVDLVIPSRLKTRLTWNAFVIKLESMSLFPEFS